MPGTKRRAVKQVTYRCVQPEGRSSPFTFDYPADADVRRRIRAGEKIPRKECGVLVHHTAGDILRESDLPPEVFASCIRRGWIELVGPAAKPEEESDGTQG